MNAQFILLTQSVTGAVIEIILLLLVAAVIGFLTAWYYQKSYYTPIIKKLEAEKEELNLRIDGLNRDIAKLNNDIAGHKARISDLEKIITLKDKEIEDLKKQQK